MELLSLGMARLASGEFARAETGDAAGKVSRVLSTVARWRLSGPAWAEE
jgi:hypothetical protein